MSLAGRTASPRAQPIAVRSGGFGGVEGLVRYLRDERVDVLIDATHPFAAQMSRNAIEAAAIADTPLLAIERPRLGTPARRRLDPRAGYGCGRRGARRKAAHRLQRSAALRCPSCRPRRSTLTSSGLIDMPAKSCRASERHLRTGRAAHSPPEDDMRLFREHRIEVVLAKNSGGRCHRSPRSRRRARSSCRSSWSSGPSFRRGPPFQPRNTP